MDRCPVCGSPVRAGANFCTACGHRLTEAERAATSGAGVAEPAAPVEAPVPVTAQPPAAAAEPAAPPAAAWDETPATAASDPADVPWAMPMPAAERRASEDRWGETAPKASADLWPSPERAADPWSTPKTDAAGLGGEPSREGYAAWDAAPSSWIGWNTPSDEQVDEVVALETPEPPLAEAEPDEDQDETAPFAWPDEPGAAPAEVTGDEVAAETPGAEPEIEPARDGPDSGVTATVDESDPEFGDLAGAVSGDAARDGWDAYIASRDSARAKASEGDVVARGMDLVEQLRDLMPAIVLSQPATMRRVASDLAGVRAEAGAMPREDLDRLRGVLEASRDNPRDIEALMQLGKHATELIGLMGSFERYAVAVDRAVGELGQGSGTAAVEGGDEMEELPAEVERRS